jgi:hypothetical protein
MELEPEQLEQLDNPITFEDDASCLKILHELLCDSRLKPDERALITKCLLVIATADGEPTDFDLSDLLELSNLAETYIDRSDEIRACYDYLSAITDYQFNLPDDIDPTLIDALNKKLTHTYIALQSTLFGFDPSEFLDINEDDDEEEEEGEKEE